MFTRVCEHSHDVHTNPFHLAVDILGILSLCRQLTESLLSGKSGEKQIEVESRVKSTL